MKAKSKRTLSEFEVNLIAKLSFIFDYHHCAIQIGNQNQLFRYGFNKFIHSFH